MPHFVWSKVAMLFTALWVICFFTAQDASMFYSRLFLIGFAIATMATWISSFSKIVPFGNEKDTDAALRYQVLYQYTRDWRLEGVERCYLATNSHFLARWGAHNLRAWRNTNIWILDTRIHKKIAYATRDHD